MARGASKGRAIKRIVGLGALAGLLFALWRLVESRNRDSGVTWEPQPFPNPPKPVARETPPAPAPATDGGAWIEPVDGGCPGSHPVKGKLSSGIFHVPGGQNYARTNPDRCYLDPAAAESDGLRAAKR